MPMLEPDARSRIKELTRLMVKQRQRLGTLPCIDFECQAQTLADFGASLCVFEEVNDPDLTAALFAYDRLRRSLSTAFVTANNAAS